MVYRVYFRQKWIDLRQIKTKLIKGRAVLLTYYLCFVDKRITMLCNVMILTFAFQLQFLADVFGV